KGRIPATISRVKRATISARRTAYVGNQPSQTGEDRSPPSNMTQTLSPTGGGTTLLLLSYTVQGVAQPVLPGESGTVMYNRPLPQGSIASITVPRWMPRSVLLMFGLRI